jgi:tetratricopeptide (TPR) repeat protein
MLIRRNILQTNILILLTILLFALIDVHAEDARVQELVNQAIDNYNHSNYEEAVRLYQAAIAESHEDPAVYLKISGFILEIAMHYKTEKNLDDAISYYQKAAVKGYEDAEIMQKIASFYFNSLDLRNDSESLKWLEKSIAYADKEMDKAAKANDSPSVTRNRLNAIKGLDLRAYVYNLNGEFNKAVDLLSVINKRYSGVKKADPLISIGKALIWLAVKAFGDGNYAESGKWLTEAEELAVRADLKYGSIPYNLSYYRRLYNEHQAFVRIKPNYIQKIIVLFVGKAQLRRNVPKTLTMEQFEGCIQDKLCTFYYGLMQRAYTLNTARAVYELNSNVHTGSSSLLGVGDDCELISKMLGSINFRPQGKEEYYPVQVLTDAHVKICTILLNILIRKIEVMSRGCLSLQLKIVYLNEATITGVVPLSDAVSDHGDPPDFYTIKPYPSEVMLNLLPEYDGLFLYTPDRLSPHCVFTPRGGSADIPVIPYVIDSPGRAVVKMIPMYNDQDDGDWALIHEYFHSVENTWGISPVHGYEDPSSFPDYHPPETFPDRPEFAYYTYHFSEYIPKKIMEMQKKGNNAGWTQFGWSLQKPFSFPKEKLPYLLQLAEKAPLEDRQDAWDYEKRAKRALSKGNKKLADFMYREALKLNPACFEAYRYLGDRAVETGNYKEAAEKYAEYLKCTPSQKYLVKTAEILIKHLGDYQKGTEYYDAAIGGEADAKNKISRCLEAGNAFLARKQFNGAAYFFEKGFSLVKNDNSKGSLECLFLKGEALYSGGDEDQGKSLMQSALDRGLKTDENYTKRIKKFP